MKYLKTYESLDNEETTKTLREICLELEDIGYTIFIVDNSYMHSIDISRQVIGEIYKRSIKFSDIKEYLLRMKDYLGDKYIRCTFQYFVSGPEVIILNDDTEIRDDETLFQVEIYYR